jgi:hypothetical protein
MKFWFAFPLVMLMLSPIWLDRFDFGMDGTAEGGSAIPTYAEGGSAIPTYAEGGSAIPTYAEGGSAIPTR